MGNAIHTDTKKAVAFPLKKNILEGKEAFTYGAGAEARGTIGEIF